ncbi:unnamed protein product [Miscanthus lutarioriparius]|uniref:DUF1221 domain-containing protein n=1 Tax=Miscanthus lutarioriparius TaxID=422564 RepID=A0A811N3M0_9POAL|nr:unnamed protein product [Miscanthus lutarioriparius]
MAERPLAQPSAASPSGVPCASTGEAMLRRVCGRPSSRPRSPWCWWAHVAAATHGADCVEHHMHSLLWSVVVVLEAIELVSEVTGSDPDELARRRLLFAKDYDLLTAPHEKVHPASVLLQGDFHVRRRLVGNLKEVQCMGEAFAVKHFVGADAVGAEATLLTSVASPGRIFESLPVAAVVVGVICRSRAGLSGRAPASRPPGLRIDSDGA